MEITKEDFENAILVATSSQSEVFDSVEPHFVEVYERLQQQFLGYAGEAALESNERLTSAVIRAVCLGAFLEVVRHLDLVLTPTGFGVVANSEVSPASAARVEALVEQCRVAYFKAEGDVEWFADNACKYGFIVRYPEGKDEVTGEKARTYTYRYVGAPHATYMHDNGLCLEEYIAEVKEHTKDDPLTVAVDGEVSLIYYVPASEEGDTDVTVPKDKAYTVSGNNCDGFIVTVKK